MSCIVKCVIQNFCLVGNFSISSIKYTISIFILETNIEGYDKKINSKMHHHVSPSLQSYS